MAHKGVIESSPCETAVVAAEEKALVPNIASSAAESGTGGYVVSILQYV